MAIDLSNATVSITDKITANPIATAVGAAGLGVIAGVGASAVVGAIKNKSSKKRKTRNTRKRGRRIKHTKRGWAQDKKRRSKQKWEVAYQKRRKRKNSSKARRNKVYYAKKTGQPYIILSSGKAKFIKGKRRHK